MTPNSNSHCLNLNAFTTYLVPHVDQETIEESTMTDTPSALDVDTEHPQHEMDPMTKMEMNICLALHHEYRKAGNNQEALKWAGKYQELLNRSRTGVSTWPPVPSGITK